MSNKISRVSSEERRQRENDEISNEEDCKPRQKTRKLCKGNAKTLDCFNVLQPSDDFLEIAYENNNNNDNCVVQFLLERSLTKKYSWILNAAQIEVSFAEHQNAFTASIHIPDEMYALIFLYLETVEEILQIKSVCKKWYQIIMLSPTSSILIWSHYENRYKKISSFVSRLYFGLGKKKDKEEIEGEKRKSKKEKKNQENKKSDKENACVKQKDSDDDIDRDQHYLIQQHVSKKTVGLSTHSQLLSIIYRLRRYRRNSIEKCSDCNAQRNICSILCNLCAPGPSFTLLSEGNCRISTRVDEMTFPEILEDGVFVNYLSPSVFSFSGYVLRHCCACQKMATTHTLRSHLVVLIPAYHSSSPFWDAFAICSPCLDFFQSKKIYHRNRTSFDESQRIFHQRIGSQCRDIILCKFCSQSSFDTFTSLRLTDTPEGQVFDLSDCCKFWMKESALDAIMLFDSTDVKPYREQILKSSAHVSVFLPAQTIAEEAKREEKENPNSEIPSYLLKTFDLKEKKWKLSLWVGGDNGREEYCKEKLSKTKLYVASDVLFYYSLFRKEVASRNTTTQDAP